MSDNRPTKILYTDPSPLFRELIKKFLEAKIPNCEVTCVEDGRDVLNLAIIGKLPDFDFLILEEKMTFLNGSISLMMIEAQGYKAPPVAFFSGGCMYDRRDYIKKFHKSKDPKFCQHNGLMRHITRELKVKRITTPATADTTTPTGINCG
jgi:CheY-like chemotaxis protein